MALDESHLEQFPHVLYRMFDDERRLLYVGISMNLGKRVDRHAEDKTWFGQVAYISLQHFATRTDAYMAERRAIVTEKPLHNLAHTGAEGDPFAGQARHVLRFNQLPPKPESVPVVAPQPVLGVMFDKGQGEMQWDVGAAVSHDTLGAGVITRIRYVTSDGERSPILFVKFRSQPSDEKKLLLKYAPVELA